MVGPSWSGTQLAVSKRPDGLDTVPMACVTYYPLFIEVYSANATRRKSSSYHGIGHMSFCLRFVLTRDSSGGTSTLANTHCSKCWSAMPGGLLKATPRVCGRCMSRQPTN